MNIYHPYDVIADNKDCLHLKESETRERIDFVMRRVLPIFLLFFTWFLLQQLGAQMPTNANIAIVVSMLIIAAVLFFRSNITEIKIIDGQEIWFVEKTISGSKEQTIAVADIEKIVLRRRKGKAVGAFFRLYTKPGKACWIIRIPAIYLDQHHVPLIKERLQDMLRVTIEGD